MESDWVKDWAKVADAPSRLVAVMMRDRLSAEGIDAQILGTQDANPFSLYRGDVPQFLDIVVPIAQSDAARLVLDNFKAPTKARPPRSLMIYGALMVAGVVFFLTINFLAIQISFLVACLVFSFLFLINCRSKS